MIPLRTLPLLGLAAALLQLTGCGKSGPTAKSDFAESTVPVPADAELALGQRVYRGDCYNCHDRGKKGAPKIADGTAWAPRLTQGFDTLVSHATLGFSGPTGSEMPARGGNDDLTDAEIAAAVRYLISHVQ